MRKINSPCKSCEKRFVGCHATCKDYEDYRSVLTARFKLIQAEKRKNNILNDYEMKKAERLAKRK